MSKAIWRYGVMAVPLLLLALVEIIASGAESLGKRIAAWVANGKP